MGKISLKRYCILGFFFISILGTISHFVFGWSGNNPIVGAIFPINESVWEHLKLAVIPGFIWLDIGYFILKERNNYFFAKLISFILMILTITLVFYGYTLILGTSILAVDIATFFVAVLIGQFVEFRIMSGAKLSSKIEIISTILLIFICLKFIIFTYMPPKLEIFRDPLNSTYGINNLK